MLNKKSKQNTCCITGYKPIKFHYGYDEEHPDCIQLKEILTTEIGKMRKKGVTTFLTDMETGVGIWSAEIVLQIKQAYPNDEIHLNAVIPYEGQANRWSVEYRERYFNILAEVDDTITLQTQYVKGCTQACDRHMVDASDHIITVFSKEKDRTKYAVDYAAEHGSDIVVINPDTLKVEHTPPDVIELFK